MSTVQKIKQLVQARHNRPWSHKSQLQTNLNYEFLLYFFNTLEHPVVALSPRDPLLSPKYTC